MLGAALLARKAVERGLASKPWVKTTLAPGLQGGHGLLRTGRALPYLEKLGFNLVGFGCTTCIGNSGPLPEKSPPRSTRPTSRWSSVLSGNRNFEGRIHPDVKMNYLASPPLVVAYALAGSMDFDLIRDPLGTDPDGNAVFLQTSGRRRRRSSEVIASAIARRCSPTTTPTSSPATTLDVAADPDRRDLRLGPGVDLRSQAAVLRWHARGSEPVTDISGARVLARWATR